MVTAAQSVVESPQNVVEWNFLRSAERLRLLPEMVTCLRTPSREVSVSVPIQKQAGEFLIVECTRVLHSNARGPALGGMRARPTNDHGMVEAMAFSNTLAAAVAGVPFGGSYGAFSCDLRELTEDEREQLALGYAARIEPTLGAYRDVYAKSEGSPILNLMLNASKVDYAFGEVCGKPREHGGLLDPKLAVNALPALIGQLLADICPSNDRPTVIVTGDSLRARTIARALSSGKMKVLAVVEASTPDEQLGKQCDVLVYCDETCWLTPALTSQIRAKLVVEATPMVINPVIENVLRSSGCEVAPDLLVRAPEFIAAHLEWSQNMEGTQCSKEHLRDAMRARTARACARVLERSREHGLTLRDAAYEIAVEQIARCEALRAAA